MNSIVIIGVNGFFLISGYFGIRFNFEKFIKQIIYVYFYGNILSFLAVFLGGGAYNFDSKLLFFLLFPFQNYWFVAVYLILQIVAPIINQGIEVLNKPQAKIFLVFNTVLVGCYGYLFNIEWIGVSNGYTLAFAIYLYVIGRLLKKYDILGFKGYKHHFLYGL